MQANIVGAMKSQRMALILFVDDDHYTLQTLSKAAQVLGHRAIVADSCQGALVIALEQSPDLIITDMRLTDANGLNLVQQLKSQDSTAEIPVVVLSASPEVGTLEDAQAAGALAYLNKPIRLHILQDLIRTYTTN